jgi:hypothetical protein
MMLVVMWIEMKMKMKRMPVNNYGRKRGMGRLWITMASYRDWSRIQLKKIPNPIWTLMMSMRTLTLTRNIPKLVVLVIL